MTYEYYPPQFMIEYFFPSNWTNDGDKQLAYTKEQEEKFKHLEPTIILHQDKLTVHI